MPDAGLASRVTELRLGFAISFENVGAEQENPVVLNIFLFIFIFFFGIPCLMLTQSAVRILMSWISGEPPVEVADLGPLPADARKRVEFKSSQLVSAGYRCIGMCWRRWDRRTDSYSCVWVRHDMIAEVVINHNRGMKRVTLTVIVGQEYMDGSTIAVFDGRAPSAVEDDDIFYLPGLKDFSVFEELACSVVARHRRSRLPWIPASALEYKRRDFEKWSHDAAKTGLYRFSTRKNRYSPTFKLLCKRWWYSFKAWRKPNRNPYFATNWWLHEFGYADMATLNAPEPRAFPVVTDEATQESP